MKFINVLRVLFLGVFILHSAYAMEMPEQKEKVSSNGATQRPSAGRIALEVADRFYFDEGGPQSQAIDFYKKAANQTEDLVSAFCGADMIRFLISDEEMRGNGKITEDALAQEIELAESKAINLFNKVSEDQIKGIWYTRLMKILHKDHSLITSNKDLDGCIKLIGENIIADLNIQMYTYTQLKKNIKSLLNSANRSSLIGLVLVNLNKKIGSLASISEDSFKYIRENYAQSLGKSFNVLFRFLILKQSDALINLREEIMWLIAQVNFYKQVASPDIKEAISCLSQLIYSCENISNSFATKKNTINNSLWGNAQHLLGKIYYLGADSISPDYLKSYGCFMQAFMSRTPFIACRAAIALGQLRQKGKGCILNTSLASNFYTQGLQEEEEKKGFPVHKKTRIKACFGLASLHYFGKEDGSFKADLSKAKEYFELVSQQDEIPHLRADAFKRLGDIYYYGKGVKKDLSKAKDYYIQALEGADPQRVSHTLNQLARLKRYFERCSNRTENIISIMDQIDE